MMQTGVKKGVEHDFTPHSQTESRSHHHVELVIARILAKQNAYMKEGSFRHTDVENEDNEDKEWYSH
jgi:hypothetical protein